MQGGDGVKKQSDQIIIKKEGKTSPANVENVENRCVNHVNAAIFTEIPALDNAACRIIRGALVARALRVLSVFTLISSVYDHI